MFGIGRRYFCRLVQAMESRGDKVGNAVYIPRRYVIPDTSRG
jgi:hypothetical protein